MKIKLLLSMYLVFIFQTTWALEKSGMDEALAACQDLKGNCTNNILPCTQIVGSGNFFSPNAVATCRAMIGNISCSMNACMESIKDKKYSDSEAQTCKSFIGNDTSVVPKCMANLGKKFVDDVIVIDEPNPIDNKCVSDDEVFAKVEVALEFIYNKKASRAIRPLEQLRAQLLPCLTNQSLPEEN